MGDMDTVVAEQPQETHFLWLAITFGVVRSANGGGLLPKDVCVFGWILELGAEQSVWESVGVGEILGRAIEAKDIENDAGVSCCHLYGVGWR